MQAATILKDCVSVFKGSDKARRIALPARHEPLREQGVYKPAYISRTTTPATPKASLPKTHASTADTDIISTRPTLSSTKRDHQGHRGTSGFSRLLSPRSDKVSIAQNAIFELQDKLTLKQLQNAQLYYNLRQLYGQQLRECSHSGTKRCEGLPLLKVQGRARDAYPQSTLSGSEQLYRRTQGRPIPRRGRRILLFINNYPDSPKTDRRPTIYSR